MACVGEFPCEVLEFLANSCLNHMVPATDDTHAKAGVNGGGGGALGSKIIELASSVE